MINMSARSTPSDLLNPIKVAKAVAVVRQGLAER